MTISEVIHDWLIDHVVPVQGNMSLWRKLRLGLHWRRGHMMMSDGIGGAVCYTCTKGDADESAHKA